MTNEKQPSAIFDKDARAELLKGYEYLYNAVSSTLGPKGRNVIIYRGDYNQPLTTKDGVTVARSISLQDRFAKIGVQLAKDIAGRSNDLAGDGPVPVDYPVLTPEGFVPIKDVKVGDMICGTNKSFQTVEGSYDKGQKEIFEVHFEDGRVTECSKDHLWEVRDEEGNVEVITVAAILDRGLDENSFYVPITPVEFSQKELPLSALLLGQFLGNKTLESSLDEKTKEDLGLGNITPETAFIPKVYLYSNIWQRRDLLKGIISQAGELLTKNTYSIRVKSSQLKDDILELSRGLGDVVVEESTSEGFKISKVSTHIHGNKIVDIKATGKFVDMMCIKVSNRDHLWITKDYVVTHNTTSSTVLGYSILKRGIEALENGAQPVWLKEGMQEAVEKTLELLNELAVPIRTEDSIKNIARISANNDTYLGDLIAEAITTVGNNGTVTTKKQDKAEVSVTYNEGYSWNQGFLTDLLYLNGNANKGTEYEDCDIVIIDNSLDMPTQALADFFDSSYLDPQNPKPLVIIARDATGMVLHSVTEWVSRSQLPIGIITAPSYGETQSEMLKDIATITGAKVIKDISQEITEDMVGKAGRVAVKKSLTVLYDTKGTQEAIDARTNEIREVLAECKVDADIEELDERIAKLSSSIATLHIGAKTEFEQEEMIHRIEDALSATRAAIEEGIVPGGGIALKYCSEKLTTDSKGDVLLGFNIVKSSLLAPLEKILENGGYDLGEVEDQIYEKYDQEGYFGFDAKEGKVVDMLEAGIIDPVKVTKTALESAHAISSMLLLTSCVVIPN